MLHNLTAIFITIITWILCTPITALPSCTHHDHGETARSVTHIHTTVRPENAGDGKYIVVVDAGHGGHDPGCVGDNSQEKHIALDIAKKLRTDIRSRRPDIQVIMTRDKDVFVPLYERIAIANRNKADLFISIHCNFVGKPHVCGSETFVMGLHRADDNLEVAKRENSVVVMEDDFEKNYDGYDPDSPIGHILLSNYQNAFLNSSISLAAEIEKSIGTRSFSKSRGVKQAGFVVLREATMPSVLVEAGFLSNAKEEAYLLSQEGQQVIASGISSAVDTFLPIKPQKIIAKTRVKKKPKQDQAQKTRKPETPSPKPQVTKEGIYAIQIGVFSKPKLEDINISKEIGEVIELKQNNLYKYLVGKYSDKDKATSACLVIKTKGYKDAYVVELK